MLLILFTALAIGCYLELAGRNCQWECYQSAKQSWVSIDPFFTGVEAQHLQSSNLYLHYLKLYELRDYDPDDPVTKVINQHLSCLLKCPRGNDW